MKIHRHHERHLVVALVGAEARLNAGLRAGGEAIAAVQHLPLAVKPDGLEQTARSDIGRERGELAAAEQGKRLGGGMSRPAAVRPSRIQALQSCHRQFLSGG